ncbi:hypothetical protein [Sphingomonas sp. PAMC26645]|nr:hypothetical protein [Sphingomonas sp. PAMC26645]
MPALNTIVPDGLVRPIGVPSAPTMIDVRDMAMSHWIPGSFIRQ